MKRKQDPIQRITNLKGVGNRVRELRVYRGLSQTDMVDRLQSSASGHSKLEAGRVAFPRNIHKIAKVLKCNPAWLQFGEAYAEPRIQE